jgi:hypothetical protein
MVKMAILVRNLSLGLDEPEQALVDKAARRMRIDVGRVRELRLVRRTLDARKREEIHFSYNVEVDVEGDEGKVVSRVHRQDVVIARQRDIPHSEPGDAPLPERPVVVGFGPAGMFAALYLAERGYCPLVLERGQGVRRRHRDVMVRYYQERDFDPESNLLFGEGGAGAYSDGKLYTQVKDVRVGGILDRFAEFGADDEILIAGRPHVGSDKLPTVCRRMRKHIESLGGEVRFGARVDDVEIDDGQLKALVVNGERLGVGPVILGIGHSARDTLRLLSERSVRLTARPFQMGVRIEHPQAMVDGWQYGSWCGHERLEPADYHLVARGAAGDAGDVFSFCMCPGGTILPTNESHGQVATNGASRSKRSEPFANSGLVMTISPEAFGNDPLAGLAMQDKWERAAFAATGGSYKVPIQRANDFIAGRMSEGTLETSFPLGGQWTQVRDVLPNHVADAVAKGLAMLDAKLPGFAGAEGLVTGPETRASAPVRIERDPQTRESVTAAGLYPVGEGAGYAGGIISAAIDGLKTAEQIVSMYKPIES